MTSVAIVYFTGSGTTKAVADFVIEGVASQRVDIKAVQIESTEIVEGRWQNEDKAAQLDECDAIIFGSPTYMGSVAAQMKSFFDAMAPRWYSQAWNGKVAGAFTVSAKSSGDKVNCLQDISTFAMQMGMIWVGAGIGPLPEYAQNGVYLGLGATAMSPDAITDEDQATAQFLGRRVAEVAAKLST